MQRIYNILVTLFGESKQGGYSKDCYQYQFNSPWAKEETGHFDMKYNLEVSFLLGKWHEWVTNYGGNISRLIEQWGGNVLAEEYRNIISDIKETKYYNLELFKDNADFFVEEKLLKLPKTFEKIDLLKCKDTQLVNYLKKRKITQEIIDKYNIGRTTWDEEDWTWRNRIIFPSYNSNGDLNYFVGRTYKENDKRGKYKNCDWDKNNIILHEDKLNPDGMLILVEGVIDCIYHPDALSLMGKVLTKKMSVYKYLTGKCKGPIYICLDADTDINETKKIYRTLNNNLNLRGRIWYIRMGEGLLGKYVKLDKDTDMSCRAYEERDTLDVSDGENPQYIKYKGDFYVYDGYKDFGEVYEAEGKNGIIKAIRQGKQFSEIELLRYQSRKKRKTALPFS